MKCHICGADNSEDNKFCGDCGGILSYRPAQSPVHGLTNDRGFPSLNHGKVRTGYILGGGLTAAVFFGLFFWATRYTYTERVWHDFGYGIGYWETVTRTIDPTIQAILLVVAMVGLIGVVYGIVSRK